MRFWTIFSRSCRLRCPTCGQGRLFTGWFRMNPQCDRCGLKFEPEPGYYLGAIYFNYGLTALVVTITFFALYLAWGVSPDTMLMPLALYCLVFPLWFFRYARSLWRGFDQYFDPDKQIPEVGTTPAPR